MPLALTPHVAASLCLVVAALEGIRWLQDRRAGRYRAPGATTAVLLGAYGIAALALTGLAPSLIAMPQWLAWTGAAAAFAGVTLRASCLLGGSIGNAQAALRRADRTGNVLAWTGVTLAAGHIIAAATIAVAMLAAYSAAPGPDKRVAPGGS